MMNRPLWEWLRFYSQFMPLHDPQLSSLLSPQLPFVLELGHGLEAGLWESALCPANPPKGQSVVGRVSGAPGHRSS